MGQVFCQLLNTSLQLFAVIEPFAEHNLAIHLNSRLIESLHFRENVPGKTVMQHFTAKLGVGRMERNVDRPQMIVDDPVNIMIAHIGERDIISL